MPENRCQVVRNDGSVCDDEAVTSYRCTIDGGYANVYLCAWHLDEVDAVLWKGARCDVEFAIRDWKRWGRKDYSGTFYLNELYPRKEETRG